MNKMKKKLMASIAMLVISTILMTSTSYAWYTINTKASAGQISVTLANTQNVEVAKAAMSKDTNDKYIVNSYDLPFEVTENNSENQFAFGGSISYSFTGGVPKLDLPATKATSSDTTKGYKPVSGDQETIAANDLVGVVYDDTGRTDGYRVATATMDEVSGVIKYYYDYKGANDNSDSANIAFSYDMFLRTNVTGEIDLTYYTPTKVAKITAEYFDMGSSVSTGTKATAKAVASTDAKSLELKNADEAETEGTYKDKFKGTGKFDATANEIYLIRIFVYFDGTTITASQVNKDLDASLYALTFTNKAIQGDASAYPEAQGWEGGDTATQTATKPGLTVADGAFAGMASGKTYFYKVGTGSYAAVPTTAVFTAADAGKVVSVVIAADATAAAAITDESLIQTITLDATMLPSANPGT